MGAERIDDFARRVRALDTYRIYKILGHYDWRIEHVCFENGKIIAVFDWGSLAVCHETALIGTTARGFIADWSLPEGSKAPSGEDIRAFIVDY